MKEPKLSPDELKDFFLYKNAFAFHDETKNKNVFTYGNYIPPLITSQGSVFRLLTSSDGGLVTLITQNICTVSNEIKAYAYIESHITPPNSTVELDLISPQISLFLKFPKSIDPYDNLIKFEESKMAITHAESTAIIGGLQGNKDTVFMVSKAEFTVNIKVKAKLETNWLQVLKDAVRDNIHQLDAIKELIAAKIKSGQIKLIETFFNTPSQELKTEVFNNLIDTAAMMVQNTIKGVTDLDELPESYNIDPSYSNSCPQKYCIEQSQDLADLFAKIPFDQIVSISPKPLPSPPRDKPDKPIITKECYISLAFSASEFKIMGISVVWGKQTKELSWPNFPPITLSSDEGVDTVKIKTTFANYTSYETTLPSSKEIVVEINDIGFCEIQFSADSIKSHFKNISGQAKYIPASSQQPQLFKFSFYGKKWSTSWFLKTNSHDLGGVIEYQWEGKLNRLGFSQKYKTDTLRTKKNNIELEYH